jgi:hypothetical protein
MQEDFLHYIWKFQKFSKSNLISQSDESVEIVQQGSHNLDSGPDFFNAQIRIGNQLWVGNVEIHLKSSDWYAHRHEIDPAYDNVILHVVWQHDVDVYRKDNTVIPTLELKHRIDNSTLSSYNKLFSGKKNWIPCEDLFAEVDDFILQNWLERLYFERLENKSDLIFQLLEHSKNDWEAVLFMMLAKNFGLKNNGQSFLSIARSFDFSIFRKLQKNQHQIEALLLGQAGLLETESDADYFNKLKTEYQFIKNKFQLENRDVLPVQFFRLRPVNFPTIRLAQIAALYFENHQLFSRVISASSKVEIYELFNNSASEFWDTHFHFNSLSPKRKKRLTKTFIDLLIINTLLPVVFCYYKHTGKEMPETLLELIQSIEGEENNIITKFNALKPVAKNAMQTQALIELKTNYCDKRKCMQCGVGINLIKG